MDSNTQLIIFGIVAVVIGYWIWPRKCVTCDESHLAGLGLQQCRECGHSFCKDKVGTAGVMHQEKMVLKTPMGGRIESGGGSTTTFQAQGHVCGVYVQEMTVASGKPKQDDYYLCAACAKKMGISAEGMWSNFNF